MDKSAIEAIRDSSAEAAATAQAHVPSNIGHLVAVPNGVTLHNVEPSLPGRHRFRGKMKTTSIPDFVTYTKNHPGGHGFIDSGKTLGAVVFFNLGTIEDPGHADYLASLTLEPMKAYLAMLEAGGEAHNQRGALDFIEDWQHAIGAYGQSDDGDLVSIPLARAISAIRKVKIEESSKRENTEGNFKQERSVLESVEVSSDAGLPAILMFTTAPYLGLRERVFSLRVSVSTEGRIPTLRFRIIGLEQVQEDIAQEFKTLLLTEVGEAATMTIGTFTP